MGAYSTIVGMCHVCACVCLFVFVTGISHYIGSRLAVNNSLFVATMGFSLMTRRGSPENEWAEVARPSFYFV